MQKLQNIHTPVCRSHSDYGIINFYWYEKSKKTKQRRTEKY